MQAGQGKASVLVLVLWKKRGSLRTQDSHAVWPQERTRGMMSSSSLYD